MVSPTIFINEASTETRKGTTNESPTSNVNTKVTGTVTRSNFSVIPISSSIRILCNTNFLLIEIFLVTFFYC
jgi:hypothetical protein